MDVDLDKNIFVFVAISEGIYIFLPTFRHLEVHQLGCNRDGSVQSQSRKH